jgi:pimeloyl-ACP methyl ester carboxylesterase
MHGTRDALIPAEHSRRLARLAPQARLVTFDAGHNDMPVHTDAYWSCVVGFLKEARLLADSD